METVKEIRCLNYHLNLFAKVIKVDKETNWLEVKCRECSKNYSKKMHKKVEVYHYYNLLGEFMESRIINIEKEKIETKIIPKKEVDNNGR